MRPTALLLGLTSCGVPEPPEGGALGWPNIPDTGVYQLSDGGSGQDGCGLLDAFFVSELWTLSARSSARDAFALTQDGTGNVLQCGYDPPGLICFESDLGTWLTGGQELAVWMDGSGSGVRFDVEVEAFETCASSGGGCPDPCESELSLHFERTVQ
ncbi:MAG: hypothetical protein H6741_26020 [Alphaproteobacteria bacterium]|nr:hypothetical protein [Alphaproteobacteria bacterium]